MHTTSSAGMPCFWKHPGSWDHTACDCRWTAVWENDPGEAQRALEVEKRLPRLRMLGTECRGAVLEDRQVEDGVCTSDF